MLPGLVDHGMPSSSESRSRRRASSRQQATGSVSASGRFTNGEVVSVRRSQIHTYGSRTTRKVRLSRRIRFQGASGPFASQPWSLDRNPVCSASQRSIRSGISSLLTGSPSSIGLVMKSSSGTRSSAWTIALVSTSSPGPVG